MDDEVGFKKNPRQIEALDLLNNNVHAMLYGGSRCVAGDTVLDGHDETIAEMVERGSGPVKVHTSHGIQWAEAPFLKGEAELIEFVLADGRQVRVTSDHRFWDGESWRKAEAFSVGEVLAVSSSRPTPQMTTSGDSRRGSQRGDRRLIRRDPDSPADCSSHLRRCDGPPHPPEALAPASRASRYDGPARTLARLLASWLESGIHTALLLRPAATGIPGGPGWSLLPRTDATPSTYPGAGSSALAASRTSEPSLGSGRQAGQRSPGLSAPLQSSGGRADTASPRSGHDVPFEPPLSYSEVVSITRSAKEPYYTLHVPGCEHYFANGILHHNSGKTFIAIRNIVIRALRFPSRHLVIRLRNVHVNISIVEDTFPKVMKLCFPNIPYRINKSMLYAEIPAPNGQTSQIWFAGTDDPARVERVLGNEYSTIFANEVSQIAWETILVMWTRLAENVGLDLKFYYDCNPPNMKHWAYTMFFKGQDPKGEPIMVPVDNDDISKGMKPIETAALLMNPTDNPHLSTQYLAILHSLPERQRARFLHGVFVPDIEGALWTFDMMTAAKVREFDPEVKETVIAVDPSVSSHDDADECGIIVCSKSVDGSGVVEKDLTKRLPPAEWAARVVDAYHEFSANCVVAEVNQGGDMVEDMIHNVPGGQHVVVKKVHGKKSKYARAEPVAQLYAQGDISHAGNFPELEEELTTYVPRDAKYSPNRLDALVYGLTYLCINETDSFGIG